MATLAIACASCEPGDLVDLPKAPQRLVIASSTAQDQPFTVILSRTEAVNIQLVVAEGVRNADVRIFEDDQQVDVLQQHPPVDPNYPDEIPIIYTSTGKMPVPGHRYGIVVSAAGFESVSSSYIQPAIVEIDDFTLREQTRSGFYDSTTYFDSTGPHQEFQKGAFVSYSASVKFTDPPGPNYYSFRLVGSRTKNYHDDSLYMETSLNMTSYDYNSYMDDSKFEGKQVTLDFSAEMSGHIFNKKDTLAPDYLTVELRSINKEYFDFIVQNRRQSVAYRDPYSQPIITYTNVNGGLGIFTGYSASRRVVYMPMFK